MIIYLVAHTGFEPVISSLRGRCPNPLDECALFDYVTNRLQSSQPILTKELFDKFLHSHPSGISDRTIEAYHYTLDRFIGCPLTAEAISQHLNSLSCRNGKLKFYYCARALCDRLHNDDCISSNLVKKILSTM
jgi:hypothetical protein